MGDIRYCDECGELHAYTPSGLCPECEADDATCTKCGGEMDGHGWWCSECAKDDCHNCGMCEDCVERSMAAAN
jgi:hypothetical protein